jgi:drug/metabolite transporter (DMT)-like permease
MKPIEWGMLVLLSVFWGGSFFFVEIALRDFQPFLIVFLRVTLAAVILLGVVFLRGQRMLAALAAVFGIATISTAMAYLLYFRILASAGATNVLLVTFLIPISALVLGVWVLGEIIHILEYAGMGFIFLGLILIDGRALNWVRLTAVRSKPDDVSSRMTP